MEHDWYGSGIPIHVGYETVRMARYPFQVSSIVVFELLHRSSPALRNWPSDTEKAPQAVASPCLLILQSHRPPAAKGIGSPECEVVLRRCSTESTDGGERRVDATVARTMEDGKGCLAQPGDHPATGVAAAALGQVSGSVTAWRTCCMPARYCATPGASSAVPESSSVVQTRSSQ